MKLKDILPDHPLDCITVRCSDPYGEDMLFGSCRWDGEAIHSLDDDYYSLTQEILRYEYDSEGNLTFWFKSEWL